VNSDEGLIYCIGLIILAVSIGNYLSSASIGFMVLGGGIITPPILLSILRYLNRERTVE